MEYRVSRTLPHAPQIVWSVLKNLEHFARDPFHHHFAYLTKRHSGRGAAFRVHHSYLPVFPFAADEVVCTVTQWEPEHRQTLLEKSQRSYRTHVQRFTLTPQGSSTR